MDPQVTQSLAEITKEASIIQTVGMVVVFVCLVSLAVIVALVGKFFAMRQNKPAAAPAAVAKAPAPAAAKPASAPTGGLTPELVAVIAAAVDCALEGRSHRILNISQSAQSPWALSGRTDIFASHRLRK